MIFFVHTPKTGRTTFESIIQNNINFKDIGYFYPKIINFEDLLNYEKFVKESMRINFEKKGKNKFSYVIGHYTYGLHEFFNVDFTYIATIRDPIKHYISLFKAFKRLPLEKQNIVLKDKPKTFENFIELYSYHNMQTFFILGLPLEEIKSNPQIAFEKTKKIIQEHYTGFIFTEYFNESLLLLNKELKFKKLFYKKKEC
jgi:hypothetical protein